MRVEKKLKVPASFLYDKIIDSVLFDIRKQTGKKLTRMQLKNFEYVKEFSKGQKARMKVEKIKQNASYCYRTSTTKNEFIVDYEITEIDENTCSVVYTETMESHGVLQKTNDIFMSVLLGYFKKRQFRRMLQMIESSY